ncbi:GNAT family N-acetyltransferase [Nocardioides houyundeii]|uniref:GNAT family N-acetyltransferase n=1 Tax=Nocardioides houyundeii TaxID=2045452 RepID=UPI0013154B8E|nr:GNAT family N-acetyltransferase [Nocardioides houyundeii]
MPASSEPHHPGAAPGAHTLGPHVVGQRVVVRRILPGQTGPSGGPAMTDVLGICRSWTQHSCVIERADGETVEIRVRDIVSGKPVPPRASVRQRVSAREAELHTLSMWPDLDRSDLGDWVLRAGGLLEPEPEHPRGRLVARANSVLAMGDPGVPLPVAASAVAQFYSAHAQPALAQVEVDGENDQELTRLGWTAARPDEGDALFQVASLARVLRTVGRPPDTGVVLTEEGDRATVSVGTHARTRVALDGDWAGLHATWVAPTHRRQGLAVAVIAEALDWAASRGATTAYLQVVEDNYPAVGLYRRLGFTTHHAYRFLAGPAR